LFAPAAPPLTTLILIGDSIGAGCCATRSQRMLVPRLERLARGSWVFFNVSRGGSTVAAGGFWPPFQPTFMLGLPGVCARNAVCSLGLNDYAQSLPLDEFHANYSRIAAVAKFWNINLICVTPIWKLGEEIPNGRGLTLEDYRQTIAAVCEAFAFPVIAGNDLVPHDLRYYSSSAGLHPNDRGFRVMARNLYRAMRGYVRY
jgi:lysophospholipase L1-like esterase